MLEPGVHLHTDARAKPGVHLLSDARAMLEPGVHLHGLVQVPIALQVHQQRRLDVQGPRPGGGNGPAPRQGGGALMCRDPDRAAAMALEGRLQAGQRGGER